MKFDFLPEGYTVSVTILPLMSGLTTKDNCSVKLLKNNITVGDSKLTIVGVEYAQDMVRNEVRNLLNLHNYQTKFQSMARDLTGTYNKDGKI